MTAAAAGQRSNEHLTQAFEACSALEPAVLAARQPLRGDALLAARDADESRLLAAFDPSTCQRVAAALAALRQPQVPTLVLPFTEAHPPAAPERDPRWLTLRADERARWLRIWASLAATDAAADAATDAAAAHRALAARRWDIARRITATFHRAGVPILAGTDAPMPGVYPGSSLHEELELLVAAGLSPAAALRAATLDAAAFLERADETSAVAVGRRADLVLLDANPLLDIRAVRRIHAVLLAGRLLRRPALDALLAPAP